MEQNYNSQPNNITTTSTSATSTSPENTSTLTKNNINQEAIMPKNFSIDKTSLLIIILLFMFSSKLWDIAWDIGKSLLYIIIIIYLISFINQDLANNIKNIIHDLTNINSNNFLTDMFSKIFSQLKSFVNIGQLKIVKTEPTAVSVVSTEPTAESAESKVVEKFSSNIHVSLYDGGGILSGGNTKNLSNIQRNDNKNICY